MVFICWIILHKLGRVYIRLSPPLLLLHAHTPHSHHLGKCRDTGEGMHRGCREICMRTLQMCADTIVGSHLVRGISGGQKKRVTTGEIVVGPTKVLLMDEISVRAFLYLSPPPSYPNPRLLPPLTHTQLHTRMYHHYNAFASTPIPTTYSAQYWK